MQAGKAARGLMADFSTVYLMYGVNVCIFECCVDLGPLSSYRLVQVKGGRDCVRDEK